ncbi:Uncharacterised protein [Shigella sonnei]|uniref:hypothetical protein n=1 Tax=Shigella sonnei TaxID=624 RepID=UPI0006640090|nr:hypothetical protein [Shigella sonnei]CSQ01243.1 Uncharacterised protein [Shigella sonnei]
MAMDIFSGANLTVEVGSIFAEEDIDGRINVNSIDFVIQNEIYSAIIALINTAKPVDEVEKK